MTLHATRDGQKITINGNTHVSVDVALAHGASGVPHLVMTDGYANYVRITEDAQHVKQFLSQLTRLVAEADAERGAAESGE